MGGAIFYASKYGSTREYADWIADATGLPVYDIDASDTGPENFDFLVFGTPVIYHKLLRADWVETHRQSFSSKPVILFTVSGASEGTKLDGWIANSLPQDLIPRMHHVALRGRQNPKDLTWYDRMMLIIGGLKNPDRQAAREELHGFDFMDRNSIRPVVDLIGRQQRADEDGLAEVEVVS